MAETPSEASHNLQQQKQLEPGIPSSGLHFHSVDHHRRRQADPGLTLGSVCESYDDVILVSDFFFFSNYFL